MSTNAKVSRIDALDTFRGNLLVYLSKARPTVGEITADVLRLRLWLQNDQRAHWELEMRRRIKKLEEAQQALFTAGLANLRQATTAEQMAVRYAKRDVDEAETKLKVLKRWSRDFDAQVAPLVRQLEKLDGVLSNDLPKAVAYLTQAISTLDDYVGMAPPPGAAALAPSGGRDQSESSASAPEPVAQAIAGAAETVTEPAGKPSEVEKEKGVGL